DRGKGLRVGFALRFLSNTEFSKHQLLCPYIPFLQHHSPLTAPESPPRPNPLVSSLHSSTIVPRNLARIRLRPMIVETASWCRAVDRAAGSAGGFRLRQGRIETEGP